MNFDELKKLIQELRKNVHERHKKNIVVNNPVIQAEFKKRYPELDLEQAYKCAIHNLDSQPTCKNYGCENKITIFPKFGMNKFCSNECKERYNSMSGSEKRASYCMEKYGVSSHMKLKEFTDKVIDTKMKKYNGSKVSEKTRIAAKERAPLLKEKREATLMEKYGVTNPTQIPGVVEKRTENYLISHGVENPSQDIEVKKKKEETNIKNWGVSNYKQSDHYKNSIIEKNVERFSNENASVINIIYPSEEEKNIQPNKTYRIKFKCLLCENVFTHSYESYKARIRSNGIPCDSCSGIKKNSSKSERYVAEFIKNLGFHVIQNSKDILNGREIDIFIPQKNLGIEFNGLYWHSEFNGKDENYHISKTKDMENLGYNLIHIFSDEFEQKQDIVESRLKAKLGIFDYKFQARKCNIRIIESKTAKEFCDNNHIQGGVYSKINYGLFYEDKLISIMSFSKPNISKGFRKNVYDYELTRFCNLKNSTVIGGASRLFKKFIKDYNPGSILSYSDNRWNTGELYKTLDFEYISNTRPNYWYVKQDIRYHRFNFTKQKLVSMGYDKNLTEREIMNNLGYTVIWDCGSSKWVWKNR